MCGRFTLTVSIETIARRFNGTITFPNDSYKACYNIAPSQQVLVIINDGKKNRLGYLKWGFIPRWAKDPSIGYKMINARSESITEKASFQEAIKHRRCLIIADSFYEWKKDHDTKTPMRISLQSEQLFAMAGIWEKWISPTGEAIFSCAIITTEANAFMSSIHHRMPVILNKEDEQTWLNPRITDVQTIQSLLQPYPTFDMEAYKVSNLVNSPKHNFPELLKEME
ncbi:SOS response-associated peptidase [Heyndrickxia ginsengihumi]|uniref:Abasic site processing protein n=1 Tax=Heyndrickxia ginsengihumi TaxID=363870 RepID=A0A0A6VD72_9BACI|nr:SOS response-associated peptidase [Heyndrickxia ginsengihumi]KHD84474.1 hypothetical protein NG54_15205 [Heyndrickxia ginsengihumi]MBE6185426.1 SOS response-associated peptidase [Bacillus sp. (in: firmicutes)]MCM3023664.1 SOS response-associated peptidase [Heyndrickxia ginsengihumi]